MTLAELVIGLGSGYCIGLWGFMATQSLGRWKRRREIRRQAKANALLMAGERKLWDEHYLPSFEDMVTTNAALRAKALEN